MFSDTVVQVHAVEWLKSFLELAGRQMLPYCPGIVDTVLSSKAFHDDRKECKEFADEADLLLKQLITKEDDSPT